MVVTATDKSRLVVVICSSVAVVLVIQEFCCILLIRSALILILIWHIVLSMNLILLFRAGSRFTKYRGSGIF